MISRLMMGFQVILVLMFFKEVVPLDANTVSHSSIDADANPATHCLEMIHFHEDIDSFIKLEDTNQQKLFCTSKVVQTRYSRSRVITYAAVNADLFVWRRKGSTSKRNKGTNPFRNMTLFFNCINNVMREQTGFTVRELANHWYMTGTESGKFLNSLVKLEDYVEGKCRNETQLNTDFFMDIPCFQRGYLEVIPIKHCMKQSAFAYLIFTKLQPERELSEKDNECILTSYQLGCIATTVREECGVEAFNRYKSVLKRIGFFRSGICSSDLTQILKTTFLENLNISESEKNIYRTILDVKRRRR